MALGPRTMGTKDYKGVVGSTGRKLTDAFGGEGRTERPIGPEPRFTFCRVGFSMEDAADDHYWNLDNWP